MKLSNPQRQALAWTGLALLCLFLIWLLAPVLSPFVAAAVLAYALAPPVNALARRGLPRVLAVLLVESVAVLLLLALLLLVVPILSKELPLLREQIPILATALNKTLVPWLQQHGVQVALDTASIKAFVLKYLDANLEDWLATALNSARIGGSFVLAIVGNAVLLPVVLFYLLHDWPQLISRAWGMVPPRLREPVGGFLAECDLMLGQYLRGQLLVMLLLAVYYSVALLLAGFDLALPVGVFTGLAVFIPYLGFGLGLVLALLAGVLQFASLYGLIAVAVVYGLGQLIEGFVLTPRLVGERIGLSPLMVIFALLAFGHLFGFLGVLIALPVSALGVVAGRRVRDLYLASPLYKGSRS
ncbi:AI-2E family transporter [Paucibacter sp. APW11]|uniref:AI-2E family transporter n=1 Tax=Roseateles aquae TaxID=3077235 RepID=A0ABU3P6R4_9BURK|nr:AI-2E family transporter [Paucibacter sp. APW11]MDT8998245.1 AI-2E family transporter [Paucibacter sp. APW11]